MILILEDNADRIQRFTAALRVVDPALETRIWRSARQMIREVEYFLPASRLISLDHDLDPLEDDPADPGDGMEVVKLLVRETQRCPVIIHSSNRTCSDWMAGEFELAGWKFHRVAPIGDDWIEEYWSKVVYELLKNSGKRII